MKRVMHRRAVMHPGPAVSMACRAMIAAAAILSGCQTLIEPSAPLRATDRVDDPAEVVESSRHPSASSTPVAPSTPDELARLLEEGELAYRARHVDAALAAFQRVVSLDPARLAAWLRLGNLHQLRGNLPEAVAAYRRVAAHRDGDETDPALRAKGLYNLTLVNLELAEQSLRSLERMGPATTVAGPREPLWTAVEAAARRLAPLAGADDPGVQRGAPALMPASAPASSSASAPAPAPEPHRQALPARDAPTTPAARAAPAPGASRTRAAARSDAHAGLPRVDYILGVPRP